jgi:hypothetical protein
MFDEAARNLGGRWGWDDAPEGHGDDEERDTEEDSHRGDDEDEDVNLLGDWGLARAHASSETRDATHHSRVASANHNRSGRPLPAECGEESNVARLEQVLLRFVVPPRLRLGLSGERRVVHLEVLVGNHTNVGRDPSTSRDLDNVTTDEAHGGVLVDPLHAIDTTMCEYACVHACKASGAHNQPSDTAGCERGARR